MNSNIKTALNEAQVEIEKMQTELAEYTKKPEHSPRFAAYKKVRVKIFENLIDCFFEALMEAEAVNMAHENQINTLNTMRFKLEAVCLLHGIGGSLFTYLQMPEKTLGELVKKCYSQNWRQTPLELHPAWPGKKQIKIASRPSMSFEALKAKAIKEGPTWYTDVKNYIIQKTEAKV